jgi:hypothetical protein
MSNIVGEGFPDFVLEQINQRQKIYGSINRDEQQLSYLEARTGWCKLVSSVNVKKPLRNITLLEEDLAKAFVLFNGTTNEGTNAQRAGIWPGTGNPNNYALNNSLISSTTAINNKISSFSDNLNNYTSRYMLHRR